MRTRIGSTMLAAGLAAGVALAATKPFEGTIAMTLEHPGPGGPGSAAAAPVPMTFQVKGPLTRVDMAAGPHGAMTMIIDSTRQVMIMLMAAQSMYMEMPMHRPQPAAGQGKAGKLVKTGKTETILGYACQEYTMQDAGGSTEIWATKGLGTFAGIGGGPGAPRSAWETELASGGFFPLRTVHRDAAGTVTVKMTVTSITPKPLADALFAPPADYKKFEMPAGVPGAAPAPTGR